MTPNMTSCREIQPDLVATATGDAVPGAEARVQQHVNACAPCRRELDRYRSIDRIVGDIRRAPVAGDRADIVRGETVKAMVRLKPGETATEQEIRQYCQERMADYKLPREIEFVSAIPETVPLWRRVETREPADLMLE